jgi:Amt family ammonium transporter
MTTVISAIMWWFVGLGFAFGNNNGQGGSNGFIGDSYFAKTTQSERQEDTFPFWFFQWTFCSAASTIVSGAVAERTNLTTYFVYTCPLPPHLLPF